MSTSDFRSDTVTLPSDEMREAMASAEVGDDVLDGDPTVGRLEAAAAAWLGKEGALFVSSGTMANQVALGAWTSPGHEIICERGAHIVNYEAGVACLSGTSFGSFGEGYLRFSYANSVENIREGIGRIRECLQSN